MSSVFATQIATAQRLISKFGQACTWRKTAVSTPNPAKPWEMLPGANTDATVKVVFVSKFKEHFFLKYMANTEIPEGLFVGYMAAQSFTPAINDILIRGSETLTIQAIDIVAPNGEPILYIITVKR